MKLTERDPVLFETKPAAAEVARRIEAVPAAKLRIWLRRPPLRFAGSANGSKYQLPWPSAKFVVDVTIGYGSKLVQLGPLTEIVLPFVETEMPPTPTKVETAI